MNARVALMERKDLYNLLEAKMEGLQIANIQERLEVWRADNVIAGVSFVRRHRTFQDEVDRTGIDVCYQSLLKALKATVGTLPNSLAVFEYMRSIFDSYVNPTNDPNVQPLVKELDVDDFSMDKFFGLQDPTTLDDAQASLDFEEDLRTNERVRLRAEVRNLGAEPQWLTRSIFPAIVPNCAGSSICESHSVHIVPENEGLEDQGWPRKEDLTKANLDSTIYKGRYLQRDVINMYINEAFLKKPRKQLHNMFYVNTFWFTKANELVARYDKTNHAEEPMIKITCLRKSICPEFHEEDMQGNLPAWIFVPIHGKNHWSLPIIRLHNNVAMLAHLDSFRGTHDPEVIFHIFKTVLCLIVPIDLALIMTAIMNVEQQQDGHSCGKYVLQMLVGATRKESNGLDRCFREEGLIRYIATLDQVRSFDVVFGMYLSGKMAGSSM
ncbi:hypothetical protein R1flu_021227 [Riccia fluitans]|uniref:Ubiquitin-like protease family profile domain-containing protein n=1 Tax=Riccia fluitans TaxID=41844 RepID=A0ABD1ZNR6_9MARC